MAERIVKVVEDGSLATDDGWMVVRCEATGELYFVVERSAAQNADKLDSAWRAVAPLVIEQAVRAGIVEYVQPAPRAEEPRQPGFRAAI